MLFEFFDRINSYLYFILGIPYGKDVEYLFGYPFMNETLGNLTGLQPTQWDYTDVDKNISVFMQDAFANFTKYR